MPERQIEFKQVLVVNRALKLSVGKWCSQCAHAAMMFLIAEDQTETQFSKEMLDTDFGFWMESGMKKCVLRVDSAEALDRIEERARAAGLHVYPVIDAGRTALHGVATKTVIAIGPNQSDVIDSVTGELPLL